MEKIRPQTARQPKKSIIADQSRPKTAHADRRVSFHFPERDRFVTTPEPLLDLDLTDYEPIPQNPSIMIKKERPRSCPPSTRTVLPLKAYIPPTSLKTQTVRTNLEKFQIETTTLRRVRFLIESKTAQQSHLSMLSVLEYSTIPPYVIQSVFGQETRTLFAVKVLLVRAIEERNKVYGSERPKQRPSTAARRVTTPQPLLEILDQVEQVKKGPRKVNWKKMDSMVSYTPRKQQDEVDKRQLLGSILLAKKLGLSPQ